MDKFLAVVKLEGNPLPSKLPFEASHVGGAIDTMLRLLNRTSTVGIDEFEILQLLPNNEYLRVASKNKREERVVHKPVIATVVGSLVPEKTDEEIFTPYELKVA